MGADWMKRTEDFEDVWQGPGACVPMLDAFMRARGSVDVLFSLGVQTHRPGVWLILVEIEGERFAIAPPILRSFGRSLLESMKLAKRLGAPDDLVAVIREFADTLVFNAEQALELSPHGLH